MVKREDRPMANTGDVTELAGHTQIAETALAKIP